MASIFESIFGGRDLVDDLIRLRQSDPGWVITTNQPKSGAKPHRDITIGCGIVVVQDRTILTLRRLGGWWPNQLALVGGHPEEGEAVHDTAVRETLEEVGLIVRPRSVNGHSLIFHTNEFIQKKPFKHHFSVYVVADVVGGTLVNKEPDKHRDLRWMRLEEIEEVAKKEKLPLMPVDALRSSRTEIGI